LHAFLVEHGLTMNSWTKRAGLSRNILSQLFFCRTQSLTHDSLRKLAQAAGVSVSALLAGCGEGALDDESLVTVGEVREAVRAWAATVEILDPDAVATAVVGALTKAPPYEK